MKVADYKSGFLVDQVDINIFSCIYTVSQWPINISPKEQAYSTPQPSTAKINLSLNFEKLDLILFLVLFRATDSA